MYYKDKIISALAREVCERVSAKVIKNLRKVTQGMQSGDDTPLRNIWDEVCVQMKVEQSVMWDAYEETILDLIEQEVRKLDNVVIGAIWLQTDEGEDWESEIERQIEDGKINEYDVTVGYDEGAIAEYILREYLLRAAADFTNKRIEKYIDEGYNL